MCDTPAYRRLGPSARGQQATSSIEKPFADAHSATSSNGVSGKAAVSKPSFM